MELDAKKIAAGGSIVALLGGASQLDRFTVSEDELYDTCTSRIERLEDHLERHIEKANSNTKKRNELRRKQRELYGPLVTDPDDGDDENGGHD